MSNTRLVRAGLGCAALGFALLPLRAAPAGGRYPDRCQAADRHGDRIDPGTNPPASCRRSYRCGRWEDVVS